MSVAAPTINSNEALKFIYQLQDFLGRGTWVSRYDRESDAFSLTTGHLPDNARIRYFGNEIGFYVTCDNKIKGIFIEYFKNNFIEHHKDAIAIKRELEKKERVDNVDLVEIKMENIEKTTLSNFQEALQEALAENIQIGKE